MLFPLQASASPVEQENTVHLSRPPARNDFVLRARPGKHTEQLRVVVPNPSGFRDMVIEELPVRNGDVDLSDRPDLCWVAVLERHGRSTNRSLSVVRGMGLHSGAVASTVAHDSHNLVVAGRDAADMVAAASALVGCGGGICCVSDGQVTALLPLPIAGLMSPLPLAEIAPRVQNLSQVLISMGFQKRQPLLNVLGLALPVIPHYGLTDRGLIDVDRQAILPIWADEA